MNEHAFGHEPRGCPERETLAALLEGRISPEAFESLATHVELCPLCGETLAQLSRGDDPIVAALREPPSVEGFSEHEQAAIVGVVQRLDVKLAKESASASLPITPHRLGRYELIAKIGEGGMGAVYKAVHLNLGKTVAIKMLAADRVKDEHAVARLKREMKAVGSLHHPHIVGAHDADEVDGVHFLVMEYVDGIDLGEVVQRVGPLPFADACEIIRQAAMGLAYAHRNGLVHRDVKPSNLMLTVEGQVKMLDLGLALLVSDGAERELTRVGRAMGTVDYMAPEQSGDSHLVDARCDIYSLGCTLFKLLSSRVLFAGSEFDSALKKMMAHVSREPPSIVDFRPDVPPALSAVLKRMLAKKPADRIATADELTDALSPFSAGSDLQALYKHALLGTSPEINVASSAEIPTDAYIRSSFVPTASFESLPVESSDAPTAMQMASASGSGPPSWRNRKVLLGAAGAGAFALLLGVIVSIRNRQGDEVARVSVPDGGTVQMQDAAETPSSPRRPAKSWRAGETVTKLPGLARRPADLSGGIGWQIEQLIHHETRFRVSWHPEDPLLAVAGSSGYVRIYKLDGSTLRLLHLLAGHTDNINDVAWSPDARYLATAGNDYKVILWDMTTAPPRAIHEWTTSSEKEKGRFHELAWNPAGSCLAAGLRYGEGVIVWDARDFSVWRETKDPRFKITSLDWSSDAVAFTCEDGGVWLWEPDHGKPTRINADDDSATCVAVRSDGKEVSWNSARKAAPIWDVASSKITRSISLESVSRVVKWRPDGHLLYAETRLASSTVQTKIFDTENGEIVGTIPFPARDIAPHRAKPILAIVGVERSAPWSIGVFDIDGAAEPIAAIKAAPFITAMSWCPDGEVIALGAADQSIRFLNATDGTLRKCVQGRNAIGTLVGVGADEVATAPGRLTAAAGPIDVWSIGEGKTAKSLKGHANSASALAADPKGRYLASGSSDNTIRIWDMATRQSTILKANGKSVQCLSCSPDGEHLAVVDGTSLVVWSVSKSTRALTLEQPYVEVSWSPAGDKLALERKDGTREVRTIDGELVHEFAASPQSRAQAWHPHGRLLGVPSPYDLDFFDVDTGREQVTKCLRTSMQHVIQEAMYSPDGKRIAIARNDNCLEMWDAVTADLLWTAVLLGGGRGAVVSGTGELWTNTHDDEHEFAYVIRQSDGTTKQLTPAEFRSKVGK
jgi:serine/threonine protein kinase